MSPRLEQKAVRDVLFGSPQPRAVRTFWRILQRVHPQVWRSTFSILQRDPEHSAVLGTLPPDALREHEIQAGASLATAARGDSTRFEAFLRSQALMYAERGLSFSAW